MLGAGQLAGQAPPCGGHLRTERMQHPLQQWALVRREESEPPACGDGGGPTPNTSAFRVKVEDGREPLLAVFRRATWAEEPWRAMPYVWAPQWDRRALDAVIACARETGIRTLDIWACDEMAEVLSAMGAEARGQDNVLVRRLRQRTTSNEQRRS